MKDTANWFQIMITMKELHVDIFGFAEINRSLNRGYKKEWIDIIRKLFYYSRTTHSESNIHFESLYKPGGSMTTITGKWQSRVTNQRHDPKGLGRWCYMRIASKKSSMIIATAYRPYASQGPITAWIQQWTLLRESGDKNPDPIKYFYTDLEKQISQWKQEGNEVLMMIDANEHIGDKPGGLTTLFEKMEMTDLLRHRHPNKIEPNTHARGSKRIDYIFGTAKIRDNCKKAGILQFGTGYQSDHRALFVSIDIANILSAKVNAIDSITAWKLQQATPKEKEKFIQETDSYLNNNNVYERLHTLQTKDKSSWSLIDEQEYETCNLHMIHGMLLAEKRTRKMNITSWSPIFGKAVAYKTFWKIALSLKINHKNPNEEFINVSRTCLSHRYLAVYPISLFPKTSPQINIHMNRRQSNNGKRCTIKTNCNTSSKKGTYNTLVRHTAHLLRKAL
jgi:hypothetical protein